ncbi:hypothetical protein ncot_14045 [Nocardioides sp. JQ2195]|uniref:hypothetical protein n=1 Tax=Nocardioides sp. JQ2195 TaxID=2592334 RepID=UPI00143EACCA|nr:hypothetical protein [Nocardioides sp. JQ2195]QIX27597.1 hypothetical protein ncot_14045 [Nocardioides sp. JQ2195]
MTKTDLTNERFGLLVVVRELDKRGYHRMYECRCDCGNTITVRQSDLKRRTRSCGCTGGRPRTDDGIDRGYPRAHERVRAARGPASEHECIDCPAWADTWSYVRGCPDERSGPTKPCDPESAGSPYCEHIEHYQPRCFSCHSRLDRASGMTVRMARAMMLNRM